MTVVAVSLCTLPAHAQIIPTSQAQIALSFAPVVKRVAPAVVNIYAQRVVRQRVGISPFMNDPLFRQFFGDNPIAQGPVQEKVERSLGSGVIIGADGIVVTSHHVIKDAKAISVALSDRREFEAKVIRRDPQTDLAFLQIEAKEALPFIELRDSDSLEVGELALAIGNPFGVGQTVTQGIISALARNAAGVSDYQFFIQTDAAINPGNSGGALVDMQGRLIGINTAIYSTSGSSAGIGFAIPANTVKAAQASQVREGQVIRPWFGFGTQAVTHEVAESMGLKKPQGALVRTINPGGPAEKAGMQVGDVVISVGANAVEDDKMLYYRLGSTIIGNPMELTILRKGLQQKLTLTPTAPPADTGEKRTLKGNHPLKGLEVATITPKLLSELGVENATPVEGVMVLKAGSAGGIALQAGDIIAEVNGSRVASVAQLERALASKTRSWNILVQRGPNVLTLSIRL
jgi:Do/DeqQ family serine protease